MRVKNLDTIPIETIVGCFLEAFENYFVEFPKDLKYFKKRWEMSKIDYSISYGMFHGQKLVGFVLHGIDFRRNHLTAFNLATGVIPDYRGKKITKRIYDFAIPELKNRGITKCQLEVIKNNAPAVNTYENIGFTITKNYKCFSGDIVLKQPLNYSLKEIHHEEFNMIDWPNQTSYSWENQEESLVKGEFKWYLVSNKSMAESYFIINPLTGYIPKIDVLEETDEIWQRLFSAVNGVSSKIKINNVDEQLAVKINRLQQFGLNNTIDQFEMELLL
ncbi:GNAT family N-acetyltransferase [Aegicerativicinus sediminis]|uniref:GNAT family N-acetyltransferase n=1 Tax=Aegicerativicinus sediminis TaxID=2893202 RepID=UPI001E3161FE|nr:N-acetyltransferase [Aegicerativicinus sediminis]